MSRKAILALVLAALVAAGSGCCCVDPCGTACGPMGGCGSCGGCEGGCGEAGYGMCQPCTGPLTWLFGIFTFGYCDGGCGELYVNEWCNDPPHCCDPCDQCGNYMGGGCDSCGGGMGGYAVEGAAMPASPGCGCAHHSPATRQVASRMPAQGMPQRYSAYAQNRAVPQGARLVSNQQAVRLPQVSANPNQVYPGNHPQAGQVIAQRMVSQTDRVVGPAAGSAPAAGQPVASMAARPMNVR